MYFSLFLFSQRFILISVRQKNKTPQRFNQFPRTILLSFQASNANYRILMTIKTNHLKNLSYVKDSVFIQIRNSMTIPHASICFPSYLLNKYHQTIQKNKYRITFKDGTFKTFCRSKAINSCKSHHSSCDFS